MAEPAPAFCKLLVALLAEGVGRNHYIQMKSPICKNVALLAEGVGRNQQWFQRAVYGLVALLAEGVGRNI